MTSAIALFDSRQTLLHVHPCTPSEYADRYNLDIEWGDHAGTFYLRGERWPLRPAYFFVETIIEGF
jgi:hypothetical protein